MNTKVYHAHWFGHCSVHNTEKGKLFSKNRNKMAGQLAYLGSTHNLALYMKIIYRGTIMLCGLITYTNVQWCSGAGESPFSSSKLTNLPLIPIHKKISIKLIALFSAYCMYVTHLIISKKTSNSRDRIPDTKSFSRLLHWKLRYYAHGLLERNFLPYNIPGAKHNKSSFKHFEQYIKYKGIKPWRYAQLRKMCDAYPDQHIIYVLNEVPPKCSSDSIIHYFSLPQLVQ